MAQKYGTTLDTTSTIFPRLRYAIAYGANSNSQLGPVYTKIELKVWCPSRKRDHSSYADREICCNDPAHRYAKEVQKTEIRIRYKTKEY
jgi:hypothetical protein